MLISKDVVKRYMSKVAVSGISMQMEEEKSMHYSVQMEAGKQLG